MKEVKKIYLLGFMGAGKTSVGRMLARELAYDFADMDEEIEKSVGKSVQDIFSIKGEEWFRAKEREVLHLLGGMKKNMVISTGGGAPCFGDNMDFINSTGTSVYLKMTPGDLARRLINSKKQERPLIKNMNGQELLEFIVAKLGEREAFYLKSQLIVPAESITIPDLKNKIFL